MLILMKADATPDDIEAVCARVRELGFTPHQIPGATRVAIGITGNPGAIDPDLFARFPAIAEAVAVSRPWKLVSREVKPDDTVVRLAGPPPDPAVVGGGHFSVMAGPCAVESRDQLLTTARAVKSAGARMLRGGAYKPRTSPYDFQGLGEEALELLSEARRETGLSVVTEVMSTEDVDVICEHADMLQVGARNMQNFALLRRLATVNKPVLLKRGPSALVKEWLLAAEYLLSGGNHQVVLCERGIKTFETEMRNTIDLAAVALARDLSHLPVIADPSHGTGKPSLIAAVSRAAVAVGADGLII